MNKLKHIVAIVIVLGVISGVAFVLQKTNIGEKLFNRETAAACS